MNRINCLLRIPAFLLCLVLYACGSGGGGDAPPTPPVSNSSPTFTSDSAVTIPENQTVAYTATASDADSGDSLSFSIAGGDDSALFSMAASTGELSFTSGPDFENAQDVGADNLYNVDLSVSDGRGGSDSISVAITVSDVSALELEVTFPTADAELGGDATEIIIAGNLTDVEDGETLATDVEFIDVNGVMGVLDAADLKRWSAEIPVSAPETQIDVSARSMSGADLVDSFTISNQKTMLFLRQMIVDEANNRAIVPGFYGLLAVDLTTGLRTVFASDEVGTGPDLGETRHMALDSASGLIYARAGGVGEIFEIDLSNGNRRVVSSFDIGTGPDFTDFWGMCFNSSTGHLLLVERQENAVIDIDPATGNRLIISDASTGTGTLFDNPEFIACDGGNNRVLVLDGDRLHSVDLATGNRIVLSENFTNSGPVVNPYGMIFDRMNSRVLASTGNPTSIVAIDLSTGDRTAVSDESTGTGQMFKEAYGMAWDVNADSFLVLDPGAEILHRVSSLSGDRTIVSSNRVGTGLSTSDHSYYGQTSDAIFVAEHSIDGTHALHRIDKASGNTTLVSGNDMGSGDPLLQTFGVIVRESTNMAYWASQIVPDRFVIVEIDLATGNRNTIASEAIGAGPVISGVMFGLVDDAHDRLIVFDQTMNAIVEVDLATGNRRILSDASTGTGPIMEDARALALDTSDDSVLVADGIWNRVLRIDLSTGDRTIIASSSIGSGAAINAVTGIDVDQDRGIAYISSGSALVGIKLDTLERREVSGPNVGRGVKLDQPSSPVFDASGHRLFTNGGPLSCLVVVDVATGDRAIFSR